MKTKGRPKKEDPRRFVCAVRLNEEEKEMLKYFYFEYDVSESEALRMCLKGYYNLLKYGSD